MTEAGDNYRLGRGIRLNSAQQILFGYIVIALAGGAMLALVDGFKQPFIDHLFTSVSAVSTTGLTTVNIGQSYSFAGELVILGLIQIGGLGYMTIAALLISSGQRAAGDDTEEAERRISRSLPRPTFARSPRLLA